MKYCQECGAEMFDQELVCSNCGTYQTELKRVEVPVDQDDQLEELEDLALPDAAIDEEVPAFEPKKEPAETPSAYVAPAYNYGSSNQGNAYTYDGSSNQGNAYTYDGSSYGGEDQRFTAPTGAAYPIQKYSFWKYFLLGLVTCGIYQLYYMYKWTEDTNRLSQGVYKPSMNYLLVFLLSIVTCGIYYYIWVYQQGERLKVVADANGIKVNETGVHHLLISLLLGGVGALVSQYIFFSNTNRISGVYNGDLTRDQVNQKTSHVPAIIIGVVGAIIAFAIGLGTLIYAVNNSDFSEYDYDYGYDYDYDEDEFLWDMLIDNDGSILEIGDAVVIKDVNGDPAIAVEFHWENESDQALVPMWTFDITAEQDGTPLTMTWPATGDPDVSMANYSSEVRPGKGIDFQVVFKLADETADVDVVVRNIVSGLSDRAGCTFTLD